MSMLREFEPKAIWPEQEKDKIDYTVHMVDEWHGRNVEPTPGMLWVTDGKTVWRLRVSELNGLNLYPEVKFWTSADAPMPPKMR
jgi:hypothetical protein